MNDVDLEQTISAAWDGEPVDLDALRAALQTAEGREILASYALIRTTAAAGDIEPREDGAARLRASIAARRRSWLLGGPAVPMRLAASLAAVAIGAALWVGVAWRSQGPASPVAVPASAVTAAAGTRPAGAGEQALPKPTATAEPAAPPERRVGAGRRASNGLDEIPPTPTRTIPLVAIDSGS